MLRVRLPALFQTYYDDSFKALAKKVCENRSGTREIKSFDNLDQKIAHLTTNLGSNQLLGAFNQLGLLPAPITVRRYFQLDSIIASPAEIEPFEAMVNVHLHYGDQIGTERADLTSIHTIMKAKTVLTPRLVLDPKTKRCGGVGHFALVRQPYCAP